MINPHLAHGDNPPTCYTVNGWGDRAVTTRLSDDVPADSPAGTRALELTVADHRSGDAKLLLSEAANCAPQVEAGNRYDVSVDYTSTAPVSMTAFTHTAGKGWAYWMEVVDLPATATWQTARASLPQLPEGVDRVSFGLSIAGNGTIATTNYSLSDYELEVDDPIGEDGTHGRWEVLANEMPVRAIHTTLLHDGRVLLIAGSGNSAEMFTAGTFTATLWDPTTDSYTDLDLPFDMFCSGHLTLPDGKVLISGGTATTPAATTAR